MALTRFLVSTQFEDDIGRAVDRGEALSGRDLSQRYLAILRRFYNDQGITIDPLFAEQWMTCPFIFDSRHILLEWAVAMDVGAALVGGHRGTRPTGDSHDRRSARQGG
jgi:hypothetical protein